jgi:glutamate formiminotransferase/formiminotetrahydrofolate cyclodeaminase
VKREAERHGVSIAGSEIVGLIPRRAIDMTAEFYLQIENFSPAQVLENRLEEMLGTASAAHPARLAALIEPFLAAVAQPTATPGGGSVAALAGALSASVGEMVAGLSSKKKSQAAYAVPLREALEEFHAASQALAAAIDRDAASFEAVLDAHKLPRETPQERRRRDGAIQQALHGAVEVPLEVARRAANIFEKLGQLEAMSSPSMLSDVRVARLLAAAAVRGALENAAINLESVTDAAFAGRARSQARSLASRVTEIPVSAGR